MSSLRMAKRAQLTHFLCIPLLTRASRPQLESASLQFREKLRELSPSLDPNVLGRAIRPTGTIHLTLGVMSLADQERVDDAKTFLCQLDLESLLPSQQSITPGSSVKTTATQVATPQDLESAKGTQEESSNAASGQGRPSKQFRVSLSSVKTMKSASKTSVLYAEPIDASDRLLPFCEQLKQRFTEAGFLQNEDRPLKLHATVLNTLYASSKGRGKGPRNRKPILIDATEPIQQLDDFVWAKDVVLEKVAICEMGAKKIEDENSEVVDEQYTEIASKPLPC